MNVYDVNISYNTTILYINVDKYSLPRKADILLTYILVADSVGGWSMLRISLLRFASLPPPTHRVPAFMSA